MSVTTGKERRRACIDFVIAMAATFVCLSAPSQPAASAPGSDAASASGTGSEPTGATATGIIFPGAPTMFVRLAVAGNPATPAATLAKLALDQSDVIRQAVAANRSCPDEVKEKLRLDVNDAVIEALLRNPSGLKPGLLMQLSDSRQPKICETIADNRQTPPAILTKLAHGPVQTEYLLLSLARNPQLAPAEVIHLAKVGDRLAHFLGQTAQNFA